jgi:predicted secreted protein
MGAIIALIIIIIIVVAAALGLGLLNTPTSSSNASSNASTNVTETTTTQPSVTPAPTATPIPTPSGQQIVVEQGQQFPIALFANPSTGFHWQPTFDTGALALQSQTFASNATSTPLPGAGGTEVFVFQALRAGTTSITFEYISPTGTVTQSTSYTIVVR